MSLQLPDIFHCQKCGKLIRQPHGQSAPRCCGEFMSRAVSDGQQESPRVRSPPPRVKEKAKDPENALPEEFAELSTWCRSRQKANRSEQVDSACYAELVWQLQSLRGVLLDRFEDAEQKGGDFGPLDEEIRLARRVDQLSRQRQALLNCLDQIINDLQRRESDVRDWSTVCARIDSLGADVRRYEEAKTDLIQESLEQDLGTVD